uniref:Secreted protein n=1 Tax=Plectus sambesii TaxID=2011161 RepID=A0A914VV44_9BILA
MEPTKTALLMLVMTISCYGQGEDGAGVIVSGGGHPGFCERVDCGPGQRCRSDWQLGKAICERIPTSGGGCNCPPLRSIRNRDRNTLSFSGGSCKQTVKCTRTVSQDYVFLGFFNFGRQVTRTSNFPNFATHDVTCSGRAWLVQGQPFDEFDC